MLSRYSAKFCFRELLVSIRFNEPGWQWSGSFLPDFLGDTQVKMLNYASGALNMVRAEVQNADLAIHDNMTRSSDGNSMTQLILLSDDETGFMPYRIDNFSMEVTDMIFSLPNCCLFFCSGRHIYSSKSVSFVK